MHDISQSSPQQAKLVFIYSSRLNSIIRALLIVYIFFVVYILFYFYFQNEKRKSHEENTN